MSTYNHLTYGRYLVANMKLFAQCRDKAFHQSPNSDTLQSISDKLSDIDHPVLVVVDGNDSDYEDNDAEVLIEKPQYFLMLLLPADADDPTDIMAKQAIAKANSAQIIAKLMQDKTQYSNGLEALLPDTLMVRSIGPIGMELFGVVLSFNLENSADYQINTNYWT